jgi:hypothetical protein
VRETLEVPSEDGYQISAQVGPQALLKVLGSPVGARGDPHAVLTQHATGRLDPEDLAVLVDEGHYLGGRGSRSSAKKLDAAVRVGGLHR